MPTAASCCHRRTPRRSFRAATVSSREPVVVGGAGGGHLDGVLKRLRPRAPSRSTARLPLRPAAALSGFGGRPSSDTAAFQHVVAATRSERPDARLQSIIESSVDPVGRGDETRRRVPRPSSRAHRQHDDERQDDGQEQRARPGRAEPEAAVVHRLRAGRSPIDAPSGRVSTYAIQKAVTAFRPKPGRRSRRGRSRRRTPPRAST